MLQTGNDAKPVSEQLTGIREKYEEYFTPEENHEETPPAKPSFGAPAQGSAPTGKTGPSFNDTWGYGPKKT
jgi:hypothetical protein